MDRLSSRHAITTETILSIFQLFMLSRGCGCFWSTLWLLLSDRQHLSYDGCLEVRGDYQNCVYWICTQSLSLSHLDEQFLQFSALGFVTLGPYRLLSVFLFISVYFVCSCFCFILHIIAVRAKPPYVTKFAKFTFSEIDRRHDNMITRVLTKREFLCPTEVMFLAVTKHRMSQLVKPVRTIPRRPK